jgi:hypothetical protein
VSRRWKAESVAYGICKQPSPKFMHLLPLKPDRSLVYTVCSKSFSTPRRDYPIAIKLCIKIGHMSNQRKVEFINGNFGIQSFWESHGKNSSNPNLDQMVQSVQKSVQKSDLANRSIFR